MSSYDSWKANEPDPYADDPPRDESDEPDEEPGRLMKGACYDTSKLRLRGWWTPIGFKPFLDGYYFMDYFDGPSVTSSRYLGADSFGVEPLFET